MFHLSHEELTRLLTVSREHSSVHHLAILTGFYHGMRASEITSLVSGDVTGGLITVRRLKGSFTTIQKIIPSHDPLWDERALEVLARSRETNVNPVNGYVIVGKSQRADLRLFPFTRAWFWHLMKKYCELAGIPEHKAHPHILKHTCGKLARKGPNPMPLESLQRRLGHKSLNSTAAYLVVDDEEAGEDFERAIAG